MMQKIVNPRDISVKYINAVSLRNQGKYGEALKLQRELAQEKPENARYHDSLSVPLHELRR